MKKLLSVLLCAAMLLSSLVLATGAFVSKSETAPRVGDVNGDGIVNGKDLFVLKSAMVYSGTVDYLFAGADVNGDALVNLKDAFSIKLLIMKMADFEPGAGYPVGRIVIGDTEIGNFEISVAEDANANILFAADELQKYISLARGVEIPVSVNSTARNLIVLASDVSGELGDEGVDIDVRDNCVYITGGVLRGCMYGVYEFLEKYVGWVFINADNQYCNENGSISILNGTHYRHIPVIKDRDSQTWSYRFENSDLSSFESALKLKISSWKNRGVLEKSEKYGYGVGYVGTAHTMADFYPAIDNTQQICYSKSTIYNTVRDAVIERIRYTLERGYPCPRVSVSPMDNTNYCQCRNCNAKYNKYKSYMGPQLDFVNRIADDVKEVYPDVHIMTTAYWNARKPPLDLEPRDNVDIMYCWGGCNNHSIDGSNCCEGGNTLWSTNANDSAFFERWCEITGTVYVWIYATSYASMLGQPSLLSTMREDIRYLADHGVYGVYCEGYYGTPDTYEDGNCFDLLTMYMFIRCQWDPYMTDEEFNKYENEFLRYYYGDGWEYVREWIDMNDESTDLVDSCWQNNYDLVFDCVSQDYFTENSEHMFEIIDKAIDMAKTDSEKKHMDHIAATVYWMCLASTYSVKYENGTDEERAIYAERYERLYNWMITCPLVNLDGNQSAFDAEECKEVMDPYLWQGYDLRHRVKLAKDPLDVYS